TSTHPAHLHPFPTRRSSDLEIQNHHQRSVGHGVGGHGPGEKLLHAFHRSPLKTSPCNWRRIGVRFDRITSRPRERSDCCCQVARSEEHTSELQSPDQLVCCL